MGEARLSCVVEACLPYIVKTCFPYIVETVEGLDVTLDNTTGLRR